MDRGRVALVDRPEQCQCTHDALTLFCGDILFRAWHGTALPTLGGSTPAGRVAGAASLCTEHVLGPLVEEGTKRHLPEHLPVDLYDLSRYAAMSSIRGRAQRERARTELNGSRLSWVSRSSLKLSEP
jgi:hypothetical protein